MQKKKTPLKSRHNYFWGYKTDFSEINHRNASLIWHDYFHLTTKKIVLMALMLALNIIMTIFSKYVLGLAPIGGFFVIEISFFTVLLFLMMTNFFYTFIFFEITVWFRFLLGSEPIGLIAMNLIDGFFLVFFALSVFLFKKWEVTFQVKNHLKKLFIFEIVAFIIISIITAGFAVLMNWAFLLNWYLVPTSKGLLAMIFGLNIAKSAINGVLYFALYNVLIVLLKHYQI
ncbi:hypothetical protein JN01_0213 [Entomoplasma freundtii]|uniref:Uncharacterized protein n=1 Tax=Entomoplasma freundtii TaxID=74700 RepID=A0A2K8NSP1_9MOLU|nr:ECF transporter S component [Entomoplasma freundtii]ATZ16576.1 hypothetical protein EFREU_v1c05550 [Entomoplasma freundtii]TDY58258.1 hypothetical protein JN01_0213 [Entomoplasma freundtii]